MPLSISGISRSMNRRAANSRISQRVLRTLQVPTDLAAVTDVDRVGEVPPGSAGLTQDDVSAIWSRAEDLYCTGYYPALMLCIRHHGKIMLNRAIGLAAASANRAVRKSRNRSAPQRRPACTQRARQ